MALLRQKVSAGLRQWTRFRLGIEPRTMLNNHTACANEVSTRLSQHQMFPNGDI